LLDIFALFFSGKRFLPFSGRIVLAIIAEGGWIMLLQVRGIISTIGWRDVFDILLVAVLLYKLYMMIKDTRALTLLKGLVVLLVATLVSKWLGLNVINWLLQKSMTVVMVALPIAGAAWPRPAVRQERFS